jgi:hypothetical protein
MKNMHEIQKLIMSARIKNKNTSPKSTTTTTPTYRHTNNKSTNNQGFILRYRYLSQNKAKHNTNINSDLIYTPNGKEDAIKQQQKQQTHLTNQSTEHMQTNTLSKNNSYCYNKVGRLIYKSPLSPNNKVLSKQSHKKTKGIIHVKGCTTLTGTIDHHKHNTNNIKRYKGSDAKHKNKSHSKDCPVLLVKDNNNSNSMKYENGGNSHYSIINEMNYKHNNSNQLESIKHRCKNILKQYLDIIHKLKREIDDKQESNKKNNTYSNANHYYYC